MLIEGCHFVYQVHCSRKNFLCNPEWVCGISIVPPWSKRSLSLRAFCFKVCKGWTIWILKKEWVILYNHDFFQPLHALGIIFSGRVYAWIFSTYYMLFSAVVVWDEFFVEVCLQDFFQNVTPLPQKSNSPLLRGERTMSSLDTDMGNNRGHYYLHVMSQT